MNMPQKERKYISGRNFNFRLAAFNVPSTYFKRAAITAYLLHIALPLLIGVCIYSCFRKSNLPLLSEFSPFFIVPKMPEWVIYNLPDMMWAYALSSFLLILWISLTGKISKIWFAIGILVSIGYEFGQWSGFIAGTFDKLDLAWMIIAFICSLIVITCKYTGGFENETSKS